MILENWSRLKPGFPGISGFVLLKDKDVLIKYKYISCKGRVRIKFLSCQK